MKDSTFFNDTTRSQLNARMDSLLVLSDNTTEILSISRSNGKWWWFDNWYNFWGCLITALAMSLGAPFWFDLLSRLVQLKSSLYSKKPDVEQEAKKPVA